MAVTTYQTRTPAQYETDTMHVRADASRESLGIVEVPRYSQPTANGIRLSLDKRLSLAVALAIRSAYSPKYQQLLEGTEWAVHYDGDEYVVEYEQNPAFDGVWDPTSKASRSETSESEQSDDDTVWNPTGDDE